MESKKQKRKELTTEVVLEEGISAKIDGMVLTVKGPKGELSLAIPKAVKVTQADGQIVVAPANVKETESIALWGTFQRLISNNIIGVSEGFSKKLIISGVGYRANVDGKKLVLELGFSHSVEYPIPDGIEIAVEKNTQITISGIDKQKVGQIAAEIRDYKKPEPYKGKGIKYEDEIIHRKAGKQAAGSSE